MEWGRKVQDLWPEHAYTVCIAIFRTGQLTCTQRQVNGKWIFSKTCNWETFVPTQNPFEISRGPCRLSCKQGCVHLLVAGFCQVLLFGDGELNHGFPFLQVFKLLVELSKQIAICVHYYAHRWREQTPRRNSILYYMNKKTPRLGSYFPSQLQCLLIVII